MTGTFLIQYFCLHDILPFSKSYPKIESTWSTAKCRQRKSYDTWHYIIICAMLHQNWIQLMFFQTYSEIERTWSINSSKEEIDLTRHSKELLVQHLCKFLIKIGSTWRCKIKEQRPTLTLLYCSRTVRSSLWRCSIKKLIFKILQYPQETPVLESLFKKIVGLKACNFIKKKPQHRCLSVNIAKFLRLPILKNICKWLCSDCLNGSHGPNRFKV